MSRRAPGRVARPALVAYLGGNARARTERLKRRRFLGTAAGAGLAALALPRGAFAADAAVVLSPAAPGAAISPHLYGHFIEHLGGVIYDGIWVGRDSKIPNVDGHPQAVRRRHEADRRAEPALARRLLRRRLPLARRHRPRRRRPRTYNYWEHRMPRACRPRRPTSSASTSSCASAGWSAPSRTSRPTSAPARPQEFHDWVVVLQRPRGHALPRRRARGQRRPRALQRQVLGRGQRVVGLRRQHVRRRVRHGVPQVHRAGPRLPAPVLRGHGAARALRGRDLGWTEGFFAGLQSVRGLGVRVDGLRCTTTPTSGRPPRTARSSTRRAGTRSCTRARTSRA